MIRQLDLEHQSLVVQVEPTLIRVRECTSIHVSILGDEVVVTETKDEPLIIVTNQPIHRHNTDALPLLVQQVRVLVPAIMRTEAVKLRI